MMEIADLEVVSGEAEASAVKRLEEMAREEIQKAGPPPPRRRAFLIFRVGDSDQVREFCAAAKEIDPHLDFIDFALKVHFKTENAAYVRHCIEKRIEASSIVIVLVGRTFQDCEWVDWEVRASLKMGKTLVALRLDDDRSSRAPKVLRDHRIELLPRDDEKIRDLIEKNAQDQ
jgi:hypothetical protein